MRTAMLCALVAALATMECAAQSSSKPEPSREAQAAGAVPAGSPGAERKQPAPSPSEADASKVDPSKMAAPPANGAKGPKGAPVDMKSYILGPEDQIFITVWRSAEFSGQHMIRPDGKITIPLIGELQASGMNPADLGTEVQEKLKRVLREPDVTVIVTQVNSKRYFIQGEVLKPGEYKLFVPTRVLEALVNAGGFKDFAKQTNITIMRGSTRLKFNYKAVIAGKNLDQNVYLEPGDIIIVK